MAVTKILVKTSIIYKDQKLCSSFGIGDAEFKKSKIKLKKRVPIVIFFFNSPKVLFPAIL